MRIDAPARLRAGQSDLIPLAMLVLCGLTMSLSYANKARCAGAPFDSSGRSLIFDTVKDSRLCYTDLQFLWLGRGINEHLFPYLGGGITSGGALTGGAVEYPVLSGLLMWLGGIGAHNDAEFLANSALILAPFGLATAWLLGRMTGWRAALWAAGPPLLFYAFHNWELPVVLTATAAVYVMTMTRMSLHTKAILASVLLGIGFCLKIYPGFFVLPLMAYVLTRGNAAEGERSLRQGQFDIRGAMMTGAAAAGTVVAINLPFILGGFHGWLASIIFQTNRTADITTNSVWYWGLRPWFAESSESAYNSVVSIASMVLVLAAFALALGLGWRRYLNCGTYPWVGVSGAMLCGFLLFHKVHSPQYTLWLVPFLVLLTVRWPLIIGYFLADAAIGLGVFQYFYALGTGGAVELTEGIVQFGVWGRAALLVVFFFVFINAQPRWSPLPGAAPTVSDSELARV